MIVESLFYAVLLCLVVVTHRPVRSAGMSNRTTVRPLRGVNRLQYSGDYTTTDTVQEDCNCESNNEPTPSLFAVTGMSPTQHLKAVDISKNYVAEYGFGSFTTVPIIDCCGSRMICLNAEEKDYSAVCGANGLELNHSCEEKCDSHCSIDKCLKNCVDCSIGNHCIQCTIPRCCCSSPLLMTADDLPLPLNTVFTLVPSPFSRQFIPLPNLYFLNSAYFPTASGYKDGNVSPQMVLFTGFEQETGFTHTSQFDVISLFVTGAWNSGMIVHFKAYVGSNLVGTLDIAGVSSHAPTFVQFSNDFKRINRFTFVGDNGTNDRLGGSGEHIVIDSITLCA